MAKFIATYYFAMIILIAASIFSAIFELAITPILGISLLIGFFAPFIAGAGYVCYKVWFHAPS